MYCHMIKLNMSFIQFLLYVQNLFCGFDDPFLSSANPSREVVGNLEVTCHLMNQRIEVVALMFLYYVLAQKVSNTVLQ